MTPRAARLALAATLAMAAGLRLVNLDFGIWYDEIMTMVLSARASLVEIVTHFTGVNTHPLYSLLAHLTMAGLGESTWTLRLPAAIFGVASVAMVYVFAVSFLSRVEAVVATAVIATSYHHIWFSQNARGYTLMGFLTLLATLQLIKASRTGRRRDYLVYVAAATAGVYTHLTMAFVVAGHAAFLVGGHLVGWSGVRAVPLGPAMGAWALAAVISAVCYAPFVPGIVALMALPETRQAAAVATPLWMLAEAVRSLLAGTGVAAALAGGACAAVGAMSICRRWPIVFGLLVAPAVVTGITLVALGQPIRPRFFFFLSAAAAVFVGRGIGAIVEWASSRRLVGATRQTQATLGLGGLLVLLSLGALPTAYSVPKQDFAGALDFLTNEERAGATIAMVGPACEPFAWYYGKTWPCLKAAGDWNRVTAETDRVLVVATLTDYIEDAGIRSAFRNDCTVVRTFAATLGGGEITICRPRP